MRLVSLDQKQLKKYTIDPEMLQKSQRPCALIIQLNYKGRRYDFAVPLRSNIAPNTPKELYFPLPPNKKTRDGRRHGVHYAKMFPVDKTKVHKFHTDEMFYATIKAILDKNESQIVHACQNYLSEYEQGNKPLYSTDIDKLIEILK